VGPHRPGVRRRHRRGPAPGRHRAGGFEWYEPTLQRFRVVTNRDWGCDIAGARYQFRQGEDAWVLADVKRILFEADLLDPVCLEGTDHGLLPEQVSRIDGYRERHKWCQLCGSDLSGPSRADRIYGSSSVTTLASDS